MMLPTFIHRRKSDVRWRLVAGIGIVLYLLAFRFMTGRAVHWQLPKMLQDFITLSSSVIIESLPFVLLGILLSIIVQVWLPEGWLLRRLPRQPLLRRACISLFGIFLPVCECGNVPLARGLLVKGFSVPESLTFLLAAPILNPITIITTLQAFGGDHTIVVARVIGGFMIANVVGWLFARQRDPSAILTPEFAASCAVAEASHQHSRFKESIDVFIRETSAMLPALFIGAAIAGLIQVGVSRDILLSLGANPVWSIAAMMLLAFVVSVCSNVDAFFALAFSTTFTAGSLVSFLTFGPVIDIKMLTLMRTTYKTAALLQMTVIVALISALVGLVVNYAF